MGRHILTEGFALGECCIVILLLSIFTALWLPVCELSDTDYYTFPDNYLFYQSEAIKEHKRTDFETGSHHGAFNRKGDVYLAETLSFLHGRKRIIVELGGGRLVFR